MSKEIVREVGVRWAQKFAKNWSWNLYYHVMRLNGFRIYAFQLNGEDYVFTLYPTTQGHCNLVMPIDDEWFAYMHWENKPSSLVAKLQRAHAYCADVEKRNAKLRGPLSDVWPVSLFSVAERVFNNVEQYFDPKDDEEYGDEEEPEFTCLLGHEGKTYPCSRNCHLFGDCVAKFQG